jgi:hypothetical protein
MATTSVPSDMDVAALMYLNPELAASLGVTSVESALLNYDALCVGLPYALPCALPPGFDPGAYLASRPTSSATNATVRAAAEAERGAPLPSNAGDFVGTLMLRCAAVAAGGGGGAAALQLAAGQAVDEGRLRAGDEVRVVPWQAGGRAGAGDGREAFEAAVTAVEAGGTRVVLSTGPPSGPGDSDHHCDWLLVGIRVADVWRAALAELARDPVAAESGAQAGVLDAEFDEDVYTAAYPAARLLRNRRDAFLSQRALWTRDEEYRLSRGSDAANVRAPLVRFDGALGIGMSNMPGPSAGGSGATRLAVDGDLFTTGTVLTLSDASTKAGVERITGPLERVRGLRGYTFSTGRTQQSGRRHTGLLAHEVHAALPEAVYEGADGVQAVAYGNLAGLLVEAINALAERVSAVDGSTKKGEEE